MARKPNSFRWQKWRVRPLKRIRQLCSLLVKWMNMMWFIILFCLFVWTLAHLKCVLCVQNRPSVITCAPANNRNCNLTHCTVSHNGCSPSLTSNYRRPSNCEYRQTSLDRRWHFTWMGYRWILFLFLLIPCPLQRELLDVNTKFNHVTSTRCRVTDMPEVT